MADFDSNTVLVPEGFLDVGWFNGKTKEQVLAMLDGFASKVPSSVDDIEAEDPADTEALIEEAVAAWVYAGGYDWIASDLSTRLGTIEIHNEVTKRTDPEGPEYFASRAAWWLAKFYELVPVAKPTTNRRPPTKSYTASFRF